MQRWIITLALIPLGVSCSTNATMQADDSENVVVIQGEGDGDGRVVSPDANVLINCHIVDGSAGIDRPGCEAGFDDAGGGAVVPLVATPDAGHVFGGWAGRCSGPDRDCWLTFPAGNTRRVLTATASFLFIPSELRVTLDTPDPTLGQQVTATATATPALPDSAAYVWTSSDPSVLTVSPDAPSSTATVTAVGPGTATITATARTRASGPVTVTVAEAPPEPGIIHGVLYDVDGTTALDSVNLTMGMVNPPPGSPTFRTRTGRQDPGPVPAGGYSFEVNAGRYVVFTVGVLGSRWVSTPGDTAMVLSGESTSLDLNVRRGYHLDMLGTDLGEVQAAAGSSVDLVVDYRTWCRDLGPLCSTALAIGVDGTPLAVYRFGQPGAYPGQTAQNLAIPITVPASGGTIYAMLVTTSTATGIQPGLDQYASVWDQNLQATTLIPIGTLTVN